LNEGEHRWMQIPLHKGINLVSTGWENISDI
jgi:hypothetical protein